MNDTSIPDQIDEMLNRTTEAAMAQGVANERLRIAKRVKEMFDRAMSQDERLAFMKVLEELAGQGA